MGLTLLHGKNGSGKTYHAIKDFLVPALIAGRNIITNIDGIDTVYLNVVMGIPYEHLDKMVLLPPPEDDLLKAGGIDDPMSRFFDICAKQEKTLVIFDEIQAYYPASMWKDNPLRESLSKYMTQHRKFGDDLVALTPEASKVDSAIRGLFHYNIHFKKASFMGSSKRYFMNVREGMDTLEKPLKTETGTYEDKYHRVYRSFRVDAEGTTKFSNVSHSFGGIKFAIGFLVLMLSISLYYVYKNKNKKHEHNNTSTPAPSVDSSGIRLPGPSNISAVGQLQNVKLSGVAGYNREGHIWRVFGCSGETIGFSELGPETWSWSSCQQKDDSTETSATF